MFPFIYMIQSKGIVQLFEFSFSFGASLEVVEVCFPAYSYN